MRHLRPAVRSLVTLTAVAGTALATLAPAAAAPNRPPIAANDDYSVHQGSTITVLAPGILRNDSDPDGNRLTVVSISGGRGRLTTGTDGSLAYTSAYPFQRTDTWNVTIADSLGAEATSLLTFTLTNAAPITKADSYRVDQDSALAVPTTQGVLANDSDPDGDILKADVVGQPQHGVLRLNGTGDFQYVPDRGFSGTDTFVYRADDLADISKPQVVTISVVASNVAPVATIDEYSVPVNGSLGIQAPGVLANDTDANGDPLTARLVTGPKNGTLTLNADGSFTFTPTPDYSGVDGFAYQAADGSGALSAETAVTITVATGVAAGPSGGSTGGTAVPTSGSGVTDPVSGSTATPGTLSTKPRLTLALGAHRRAKSPKITVSAIVRNVSILNGPAKVKHVAPKGSSVDAVVSPRAWTCKTKGRTTTCRLPNMTSGVSAHFSFRLRLAKPSAKAGKSTVTASMKAVGWPVATVRHRIGF